MAPSSSASKVAKLAQKGKGKKVRFQGGTLFPLIIVAVLAVLLPLVVYARQSRPGAGEGAPTINDHWHAAYGFEVCDKNGLETLPVLTGALEEKDPVTNQIASTKFLRTGVHSHGDGVIHWHPYSGASTGTNAKISIFLNNYGITLSNTKLTFPANQGGGVYEEGKSTCVYKGKTEKASLKLWVWNNYSEVKTNGPDATYITNMTNVRIRNDGMVFMFAFVPDDAPPKYPDSASNLKQLGAADGSGAVTTDTTPTTVATNGTGATVGTGATSSTVATAGTGVTSSTVPPSGTATSGTGSAGATSSSSATTVKTSSSTATTVKAAVTTSSSP